MTSNIISSSEDILKHNKIGDRILTRYYKKQSLMTCQHNVLYHKKLFHCSNYDYTRVKYSQLKIITNESVVLLGVRCISRRFISSLRIAKWLKHLLVAILR